MTALSFVLALTILLGPLHGKVIETRDEAGVMMLIQNEESDLAQEASVSRRLQSAGLQALTPAEKQVIVDEHNRLRAQTAIGQTPGEPSATNMMKMVWDEALYTVASNYAKNCRWGHNSNRNSEYQAISSRRSQTGCGENLAMTGGGGSYPSDRTAFLKSRILSLFNEYPDYTFSTQACAPGKMCGHYTQIVWDNTVYVACGLAYCPTMSGISGFNNAAFLVCNYAPPGNSPRQPYTSGNTCSQCPSGSTCRNSLCDQGLALGIPGSNPTMPTAKPPTPQPTVAQPVAPPSGCDRTKKSGSGYFFCRSTNAGNAAYEQAITQVSPPTFSCVTVTKTAGGWEKLDFVVHQRNGWFASQTAYNTWVGKVCQKVLDNGATGSAGSGASQTPPSANQASREGTSEGRSGSTDKPNIGAIVGGVLGGCCCLLICAGACMWMKKKNTKQSQYQMMQAQRGDYHPPSTAPIMS